MEAARGKKKVMVAVDDSEFSQYALTWAVDHLRDTILNSQLIIFTAQPITNLSYVYASSYGSAPPELIASIQENQKKTALALLEKAKQICADQGIAAETVTEVGDPKEKICEVVEKFNVNLLVLGSHSRGAIQRKVNLGEQGFPGKCQQLLCSQCQVPCSRCQKTYLTLYCP